MPIVQFHLPEGLADADKQMRLLDRGSRLYADILDSPVDRIRAFLRTYGPTEYATGCIVGGRPAPYFEFVVMDGRPLAQRQALMRAFTDLLVEVTGVPRDVVRGQCCHVSPEEWCIGGEPASAVRKPHIESLGSANS